MDISSVTYQTISQQCKEWAADNLGEKFIFRDSQIDCIINIVSNVLCNVKTQVCEAPTGTGKSIIAFIAAGVLAKYYNKTSYILCSDTALFKQYENDIAKYKLNFGCVCGKDNYICQRNGLSFSNGRCQMKQISMSKLLNESVNDDFLHCLRSCKFVQSLSKGRRSPVTVLTYQLWFSLQNADNPEEFQLENTWPKRDLVICDEAHKLPEIVQSLFSPRIDIEDNSIAMMIKFAQLMNITVPEERNFKEVFRFMKMTMEKRTNDETQRVKDMLICLRRYVRYIGELSVAYDKLQDAINHPKKRKKGIKVESFSKAGIAFGQHMTVLYEYLNLLDEIGEQWAVPSLVNDHTVVFNCAREADMVRAFFHENTACEFLMSATIGNLDNFRTMIASDKETSFEAFEVENGFDFTKSPIYYNTNFRLSYREKAQNLPYVMKQIEDICNSHRGVHGIIQTGSYEFSKYLWANASPELKSRIVFYNNSSDRKQAIYDFDSYGKILIGPSLLEGLNFDGDKCRFIIVMKVPYASLADRLVKAKMSVYPDWYINDVINKMVQGVGRGVRSKDDWCETYVVDGCWSDVLARAANSMPQKFVERMRELV